MVWVGEGGRMVLVRELDNLEIEIEYGYDGIDYCWEFYREKRKFKNDKWRGWLVGKCKIREIIFFFFLIRYIDRKNYWMEKFEYLDLNFVLVSNWNVICGYLVFYLGNE